MYISIYTFISFFIYLCVYETPGNFCNIEDFHNHRCAVSFECHNGTSEDYKTFGPKLTPTQAHDSNVSLA